MYKLEAKMDEKSQGNMLDWLDGRSDWQFLCTLYIARAIVVFGIPVLSNLIFSDFQPAGNEATEALNKISPGLLFLILVVLTPLFETLVECTLPYYIISRIRDYRRNRPKRCWGFVVVSACVMALLHPILPAIVPSLITGAFLAYCYAHFAKQSVRQAILATAGFHAAINMVGWTRIVMS